MTLDNAESLGDSTLTLARYDAFSNTQNISRRKFCIPRLFPFCMVSMSTRMTG